MIRSRAVERLFKLRGSLQLLGAVVQGWRRAASASRLVSLGLWLGLPAAAGCDRATSASRLVSLGLGLLRLVSLGLGLRLVSLGLGLRLVLGLWLRLVRLVRVAVRVRVAPGKG